MRSKGLSDRVGCQYVCMYTVEFPGKMGTVLFTSVDNHGIYPVKLRMRKTEVAMNNTFLP